MKAYLLKLLSKLVGVSPEFWALLEPVLLASGKTFLADAVTAALPLVVSLEGLGLPSAEKRGQAINQLVLAFLKDGKVLEQQVAALAVEFALQHARAVTAATVSTPALSVLHAQMEFQAGVNIAKRGDGLLPDEASPHAMAGFNSVPVEERGKYDANGVPKPIA